MSSSLFLADLNETMCSALERADEAERNTTLQTEATNSSAQLLQKVQGDVKRMRGDLNAKDNEVKAQAKQLSDTAAASTKTGQDLSGKEAERAAAVTRAEIAGSALTKVCVLPPPSPPAPLPPPPPLADPPSPPVPTHTLDRKCLSCAYNNSCVQLELLHTFRNICYLLPHELLLDLLFGLLHLIHGAQTSSSSQYFLEVILCQCL